MADLKKWREQRAAIVYEQEQMAKTVDERDGNWTEEENTKWDKAEADFKSLSDKIKKEESIQARKAELAQQTGEDLEKKNKVEKAGLSEDPKEAEEQRNQAFKKYIVYGKEGLEEQDKVVLRSMYRKGESRAQSTTGSEGGFTIPQGFSEQLNVAKERIGGMRPAATILRTASGNEIDWPTTDDTANTGTLLAEAGDSSSGATDIVFAEKKLNAYKISSDLLRVNRELLEDSFFNMEEVVGNLLGRRVGKRENNLFTLGTGSSQPNGVVTAASSALTAAAQTTVTRAELIQLIHAVDPEYRMGNQVGFMFNDTTLSAIKQLSIGSADDRPLWQMSMREGEPDRLEGFQYWINQDVASLAASSTSILFGDFAEYVIREVGDTLMKRTDERYFETDQVGLVVFSRIDGELVGPNTSVQYITQAV